MRHHIRARPGIDGRLGQRGIRGSSGALPCRGAAIRRAYAPIGSWLQKATVRIIYPDGQTAESTFFRTVPWQATLRRGERFRFDCERLRDARPVALQLPQ
jgi:hypothetical protein